MGDIKDSALEPEVWNNVYLNLYTWEQQTSNDYAYVLDVKQHDWTDLCTAVYPGEWEIKDSGLEPEVHMQ